MLASEMETIDANRLRRRLFEIGTDAQRLLGQRRALELFAEHGFTDEEFFRNPFK